MRLVLIGMIALGLYLFGLGGYLAYLACDPITLLTVNGPLMELGVVITLVGICTIFGSVIALDHERLHGGK